MAGFEFSATNLFKFLGLLTPFLIIFFLLMSSVINQDFKVLIYLLGTSISSLINVFFMYLIKSERAQDASPFCNVFSFPFTTNPEANERYDTPSMTSMFIAFTLAYIWLPMAFNPPNTVNLPLIITLCCLLVIDIVAQSNQKCTSFLGSFLGTLIGFIMGAGWYSIVNTSGYKSLLYYSDFTGNKTICRRPQKQYFKCDVYKNGKILQTSRF
tara:strand:- start:6200 stop:6835 length:636 start_codon:yes stop_codon:yes gene_type:complete